VEKACVEQFGENFKVPDFNQDLKQVNPLKERVL
jgi:hypothetical protein